MCDLAKMFMHCLNHWKLETPTAWKQQQLQVDPSVYRMNYTRYLGLILLSDWQPLVDYCLRLGGFVTVTCRVTAILCRITKSAQFLAAIFFVWYSPLCNAS